MMPNPRKATCFIAHTLLEFIADSAWQIDTAAMSKPGPRSFRKTWPHVSAALAALALASSLTLAASPRDALVARDSPDSIHARVVALVNVARSKSRKCGATRFTAARSLESSRELDEAATRHARDMARKKYFDHRGRDGSQPKDRVLRAGYQPRLTGENIALGPESAEETVAGWLASPGHCANIMDSRFEHIGVGLAVGRGRGQVYWVQIFGAPR
jgi:uncharacterized protein YkwD